MDQSKEVFLMTVGEEMKAEIIEAELKKQGIPVLKKHREGGDYLSIYMGKSMYGVDLYVAGESHDIAREILKDLGITDIEGQPVKERKDVGDDTAGEQNKTQIRIFKVGMLLILLLWLWLFLRSY